MLRGRQIRDCERSGPRVETQTRLLAGQPQSSAALGHRVALTEMSPFEKFSQRQLVIDVPVLAFSPTRARAKWRPSSFIGPSHIAASVHANACHCLVVFRSKKYTCRTSSGST